jgi:magnesium-transporting ATPase (P-type)
LARQDVSAAARLQHPGLYRQGQRNEYFNWYCIGLWMLNGIYQSVIIFGVPTLYFHFTPDNNGMVRARPLPYGDEKVANRDIEFW